MFAFIFAAALIADPASFEPASYTPPAPVSAPAATASVEPQIELSGVMVTLECTAFADGHIGGCSVMEETHPGLGFGDAAIALMDGAEAETRADNIQFARTIVFVP